MQAVKNNSTLPRLAAAAIAADALVSGLCRAGAPDAALKAPLRDYASAMLGLAGMPASSRAEIRDKARALRTCILDGEVKDDFGLAASLVKDLCDS